MTLRQRHRASAIALAEMLVCIGLLATITSIAGVCYAEMIRMRGAQERYEARLMSADLLLRRIAGDVREGTAFLHDTKQQSPGEQRLTIAKPAGIVEYRVTARGVERTVRRDDKTSTALFLPASQLQVEFDFETLQPSDARSVVTTVSWPEPPKIGISESVLSLRVALRNHPQPGEVK